MENTIGMVSRNRCFENQKTRILKVSKIKKLSFSIFDTFKTNAFDFQNIDFAKPCLSCSPQSISPLRVCIKALLVGLYVFEYSFGGFVLEVIFQNIDFTKPCLSCSPQSISPLRVCIKARLVDAYVFKHDYGGFV